MMSEKYSECSNLYLYICNSKYHLRDKKQVNLTVKENKLNIIIGYAYI